MASVSTGDSDGDVAAHALIDALLSAAGMGDIGGLFGVGADAPGSRHARLRYVAKNRRCIAIAWKDAIQRQRGHHRQSSEDGRRREEAERALSDAVGCRVTVTATTTDHMGFTGRGEGIAAIANALVM